MLIAIIGARMRTPATSVSNARSNAPSYNATSVEVPPMSKLMMRASPASSAVRAAPAFCRKGVSSQPPRLQEKPYDRVSSVGPVSSPP